MKFNDDNEGTLAYNSTLFANVTEIELIGSYVVDIAGYIGEKVKVKQIYKNFLIIFFLNIYLLYFYDI